MLFLYFQHLQHCPQQKAHCHWTLQKAHCFFVGHWARLFQQNFPFNFRKSGLICVWLHLLLILLAWTVQDFGQVDISLILTGYLVRSALHAAGFANLVPHKFCSAHYLCQWAPAACLGFLLDTFGTVRALTGFEFWKIHSVDFSRQNGFFKILLWSVLIRLLVRRCEALRFSWSIFVAWFSHRLRDRSVLPKIGNECLCFT